MKCKCGETINKSDTFCDACGLYLKKSKNEVLFLSEKSFDFIDIKDKKIRRDIDNNKIYYPFLPDINNFINKHE